MEKELQHIKSQQHDKKHAELSPSDDPKILELEATGTASTSAAKEETKMRYVNTNMTKLFDKPFTPKVQKDIFIPPQVNTIDKGDDYPRENRKTKRNSNNRNTRVLRKKKNYWPSYDTK
ncbi:hypothetical protein H5410_021373 [Solanum commersonii]|uniref:Uncharacterized protein n=1 Tax=Solanum commersonii TaxID=4109 RepID=A0A9J5ZEY6_SOLCO|nr:hypothetical protein H5410_021373 [Solanum commersonii]